MASLAELMAGQALQSSGQAGAGLSDAMTKGAELGLRVEQVKQQRMQLDQQKEQIQQARLAKFAEAVEKGQQYSGKAQSNYYNKFLPAFRDSLGLTQMFPNETVEFIASSPENLGRFNTLVADVRSGALTEKQAIGMLQDPVAFADVQITPKMMEQLGEAAKFRQGISADYGKQVQAQKFAQQENNQKRLEAGQVKLDTDFAPKYEEYMKDRPMLLKNLSLLEGALSKLEKAPKDSTTGNLAGNVAESVPLVGKKLQKAFDKETDQTKTEIQTAIQTTLRPILGAQFAAIEGEQIMARAFDPMQTNANNAARLRAEINALRSRVGAFDKMARYYQQSEKTFGSKTLAGYQGELPELRPNPPPGIDPTKYAALSPEQKEGVWQVHLDQQSRTAGR